MFRAEEVLARIKPGDRVLDVGGWASPFNRANWILDCQPFETRGFYATVGLPARGEGVILIPRRVLGNIGILSRV